MKKIDFQDGTLQHQGYVEIEGTRHTVIPAEYTGDTPLSAFVLNKMQENIETSINQAEANIGGEEYDNTETYEVGDVVKYEGQLYSCITAITTPEEFDSTKWQATDLLKSAGGNEIAIGSASDITGRTKLLVQTANNTLHYKNPTTGNFQGVSGGEVLPVGTEVDYDGTNVPVGWEEDTTYDTGWVVLNNNIKYRRKGDILTVTGFSSGAVSIGDYTVVGTLPEGYRPTISLVSNWARIGEGQVGTLRIETTGEIRLYSSTNTTYWGFTITYIV